MLDIPKVSKRIQKTLDLAGWTVETLAAAQPEDLTKIEGIGSATAWRIIVAARRENKATKAQEPVVMDPQWLSQPAELPPGIYVAPPAKPEPPWMKDASVDELERRYLEMQPGAEIPAMSVRVKRNWLRKQIMELV